MYSPLEGGASGSHDDPGSLVGTSSCLYIFIPFCFSFTHALNAFSWNPYHAFLLFVFHCKHTEAVGLFMIWTD